MSTTVFDGEKFALQRESQVKKAAGELGISAKMVSIFFAQDPMSIVYTNLKQAAAERVGIKFHAEEVGLKDEFESLLRVIRRFSRDPDYNGVMVQKPSKRIVIENIDVGEGGFSEWWRRLVAQINPANDVDCLTQVSLDRVYRGEWTIIPATARAVLSILDQAVSKTKLVNKKVLIVGRSELIGKPLAHVLTQRGIQVSMSGSEGVVAESKAGELIEVHEPQDLASVLSQADVIVSATGKPGLVTGDRVKRGVVVIDVGEPQGDVEFSSVSKKASFITPVPGGVGPVTVVSLLENLLDLIKGR